MNFYHNFVRIDTNQHKQQNMSQTKISTTVYTQLEESMEKFYSKLLEFVEQSIENDEWDADDFKTCFTQNMPVKANKKTAKPVKDPAKPKRARGAYIYFSSDKEVRVQIKKDNPEASSSDIMKLLGSKWSSDEYKNYHDEGENKDKTGKFDYQTAADKYLKMAVQDKERYTQEMSGYTPDPSFITAKPVKNKQVKVKTAPKRARTAYMFFCMENRPEAKKELASTFTGRELQTEVTKLLGTWWSDHKDYNDEGENKDKNGKFDYTEDAQKYVDMSETDKERVKSLKVDAETETTEEQVESTKTSNDNEVEDLYEYFYTFQTTNGYGPNYTKEKRDYKIRKAWDKMSLEQKLEWKEDDASDDDASDDDTSDDDASDDDTSDDDTSDDENCCGCDFVYSRRNAKENKNKGDSCGHETVEDSGRCAKHKRKNK